MPWKCCLPSVTKCQPCLFRGFPTLQVRKSSKQREWRKFETSGQSFPGKTLRGDGSLVQVKGSHLDWEGSAPLGGCSRVQGPILWLYLSCRSVQTMCALGRWSSSPAGSFACCRPSAPVVTTWQVRGWFTLLSVGMACQTPANLSCTKPRPGTKERTKYSQREETAFRHLEGTKSEGTIPTAPPSQIKTQVSHSDVYVDSSGQELGSTLKPHLRKEKC